MSENWKPQRIDGVPDGVILFDGVCVLCSRWARVVIDRDGDARFRFVAVQQPYGTVLAHRLGISVEAPQTNAVVLGGRAYFKSDAAIAVLSRLPRLAWVRVLAWVPRRLRDFVYDAIARNRYRLFGRSATCLVPTPELARHFLPVDSPPG
ncbi:MAG TPA: DCC1-like thiol-disulfide oxidoreductase family protein [Stellaceae bacterium]|nr:DCC1-like thiol-disulfide oxidoreductase family protein [Stellaceae bacterium]